MLDMALQTLLDNQLDLLRDRMAATVAAVTPALPGEAGRVLASEYNRWQLARGWRLINVAEPCGVGTS